MLPVRIFGNRTNESYRHPLGALARWSREMDSLFDRTIDGASHCRFPVDIRQNGEDLVVEAELPGLSREDVEITVEDNVLTIASERKGETEDQNEGYHVRERWHGAFSRSFQLPTTADGEKVTAKLDNGVLTLRVPTREEAKPRKIEVK